MNTYSKNKYALSQASMTLPYYMRCAQNDLEVLERRLLFVILESTPPHKVFDNDELIAETYHSSFWYT